MKFSTGFYMNVLVWWGLVCLSLSLSLDTSDVIYSMLYGHVLIEFSFIMLKMRKIKKFYICFVYLDLIIHTTHLEYKRCEIQYDEESI